MEVEHLGRHRREKRLSSDFQKFCPLVEKEKVVFNLCLPCFWSSARASGMDGSLMNSEPGQTPGLIHLIRPCFLCF